MKVKASKNKSTRARKSKAPDRSAPKPSKVKEMGDKDLEQIAGGTTMSTTYDAAVVAKYDLVGSKKV